MVRHNTHKNNKIFGIVTAFIAASFIFLGLFDVVKAEGGNETNGDENTTFQVNIGETLNVSLTTPEDWASGSLSFDTSSNKWSSNFLRNLVNLSVTSNNPSGVTASMTSSSTTSAALSNTLSDLTNDTIPTLTSDWTRSNTTNTLFWGYSIDDSSEAGTYHKIALKNATPNNLIAETSAGTFSQDIYFGAKADSSVASGTYSGTIVISVVTGAVTTPEDNPNDNPIIPSNPVVPGSVEPETPTYDNVNNRTVYTSTSSNNTNRTTTNTTRITEGDVVASYADPAGVTTTVVDGGTPLATGLAITAATAATTGIFFLIAAKRRKDDEEEDEY